MRMWSCLLVAGIVSSLFVDGYCTSVLDDRPYYSQYESERSQSKAEAETEHERNYQTSPGKTIDSSRNTAESDAESTTERWTETNYNRGNPGPKTDKKYEISKVNQGSKPSKPGSYYNREYDYGSSQSRAKTANEQAHETYPGRTNDWSRNTAESDAESTTGRWTETNYNRGNPGPKTDKKYEIRKVNHGSKPSKPGSYYNREYDYGSSQSKAKTTNEQAHETYPGRTNDWSRNTAESDAESTTGRWTETNYNRGNPGPKTDKKYEIRKVNHGSKPSKPGSYFDREYDYGSSQSKAKTTNEQAHETYPGRTNDWARNTAESDAESTTERWTETNYNRGKPGPKTEKKYEVRNVNHGSKPVKPSSYYNRELDYGNAKSIAETKHEQAYRTYPGKTIYYSSDEAKAGAESEYGRLSETQWRNGGKPYKEVKQYEQPIRTSYERQEAQSSAGTNQFSDSYNDQWGHQNSQYSDQRTEANAKSYSNVDYENRGYDNSRGGRPVYGSPNQPSIKGPSQPRPDVTVYTTERVSPGYSSDRESSSFSSSGSEAKADQSVYDAVNKDSIYHAVDQNADSRSYNTQSEYQTGPATPRMLRY